jgi:hypothetical protein
MENPGPEEPIGVLREFVSRFGDKRLMSTSANVVTYTAALYNVIGSTHDPKIPGYPSWTYLLQQLGIGVGTNDHCYVDPQTSDHSHPAFQVGGHMTPNMDGTVPPSNICYLMPLCKWHNGKGNNHVAFAHSLTQILELHGYMTSEPAATFMARLSGQAPAALVFAADEGLKFQTLSDEDFTRLQSGSLADAIGPHVPENHIVLRRREDGKGLFYTVEQTRLA